MLTARVTETDLVRWEGGTWESKFISNHKLIKRMVTSLRFHGFNKAQALRVIL